MRSSILVLVGLAVCLGVRIEHLIILMLENRSFDHMLGLMKKDDPRIDGCLPDGSKQCTNPLNPLDPNSPTVAVNDRAVYRQVSDPGHSVSATTNQLFGFGEPVDPAPMTGFIKAYAHGDVIMECFPPEHVPAITTLAREFAVFNYWFAGVPGPTDPNRFYASSATSHGSGSNDDEKIAAGYPQRPIFENIDESSYNRTWRVYFQDAPLNIAYKYSRHPKNLDKFKPYLELKGDLAKGDLPSFTWIEPRYMDLEDLPATDQHPDHDVGEGDRLIKHVYENLRASPVWNTSALLILYDEHGGFFDHVSPPFNVPNPDGLIANDTTPPFDFTRLGVRVPSILVSPLVAKGTVVGRPAKGHYEHSSISTTVRRLLTPDQPFLTRRDQAAAPFDDLFTLTTPRTDCPKTLPTAPLHRDFEGQKALLPRSELGTRPVNDWQQTLVKTVAGLRGVKESGASFTEAQAYHFVKKELKEYFGYDIVH